jgi:hypothetical protein
MTVLYRIHSLILPVLTRYFDRLARKVSRNA